MDNQEVEKESQVSLEMIEQDSIVNELHIAIDAVKTRIQKVLIIEPTSEKIAKAETEGDLVPLAGSLRAMNRSIKIAVNRLRDIEQRIEL